MSIKKPIVACLILLPGLLLLGAWGSPPQVIPSCPTCKVVMGNSSSTVSGTVTYMPRIYTSSKLALKYADNQTHVIPLPTLNMPFSKFLTSAKLPRPSSAAIWFCWQYGGPPASCHSVPIPIQ